MFHSSIPPHRFLLYILFIGFLPLFYFSNTLFSQKKAISHSRNRIETIEEMGRLSLQKQATNRAIITTFKNADNHYIDKNIETLPLLEKELKALLELTKEKDALVDDVLVRRLDFLKNQNNLVFSESNVQNYSNFQETLESLESPVEINEKDLHKILFLVEGFPGENLSEESSRPQLIITHFKIDRKAVSPEREVFILNMKFLKREFL